MFKTFTALMFGLASLAAGMFFDVPASRAIYFGDAPWCVVTTGDDIHWDCEYRTSQECIQALASAFRGSCNVNPWPNPSPPTTVVRQKRRQ
jgi:hypothetical protein